MKITETQIIDSIEKEEVYIFASQEDKKKKLIQYSIVGGVIFLFAIIVYIMPDFLSENHKHNMAYIGNHEEEENKSEDFHGSSYEIARYYKE